MIARRKEGGHDTTFAEDLLARFERTLAVFEDDLRAIRKENSN